MNIVKHNNDLYFNFIILWFSKQGTLYSFADSDLKVMYP